MAGNKESGFSSNLLVMIGVLAILAVILSGIGVYMILSDVDEEDMSYVEHLQLAEKYTSKGDYEQAVRLYWDAITLDKENEQAYLELGEVYEEMGDPANAQTVYRLGLKNLKSETLEQRLQDIKLGNQGGLLSDLAFINRELLEFFAKMTFEAGQQQYGAAEVDTSDRDVYRVIYPKLNAVFYFYNTDSDRAVLDTASKKPYSGKQPNEIELKDLSLIFPDMKDTLTYEQLQQYDISDLRKEQDPQLKKYVIRFVMNDCETVIESDSEGTITSRSAWNRMYPKQTESEKYGSRGRTLRGRIVNAETGGTVSDVHVQLSSTSQTQPVSECTSNSDGDYSLSNLEPGTYIAHIEADGYIEEDIEVQVLDWSSDSEQDLTISPMLAAGEIRLVLSWGSYPYDLDSYLFGNGSDGTRIRLYYGDPVATGRNGDIAELDVDCMTGYGPETTTIYDTEGEYQFCVADFNRTGTMGQSGAEVKIYVGNEAPITVSVPSDVEDQWEVCRIENGKVTVTNVADKRGWSNGGK